MLLKLTGSKRDRFAGPREREFLGCSSVPLCSRRRSRIPVQFFQAPFHLQPAGTLNPTVFTVRTMDPQQR
jgi:hypothetical protein